MLRRAVEARMRERGYRICRQIVAYESAGMTPDFRSKRWELSRPA